MFEDQEFAPMTEWEREVCEVAVNHFFEGDFQTSAEILANIVANRRNDHRFKHNLVVAEFRQRGCTDWGIFIEELSKMFNHARLTQEPGDIQQENLPYPVLWFNLAVVCYHQKRYRKALQVLEKLSKTFRNVMTPLANRTKLLLIDVLIKLQQYERALTEIELFETECRPASVDIIASQTKSPPPQASNPADSKFDSDSKIKLQQHKTLCHLHMRSLKCGKKECKQLILTSGPSHPTAYIGTCLKAYHDYLRGNVKKAQKIILNLKQSYAEGDATDKALLKNGDLLSVVWLNNEACCHFHSGKPTVAGVSFQKAAHEFDRYLKRDQVKLPLHATKMNSKMELFYNFGITLLNLKRPLEAFKYLSLCENFYCDNPRLWLRIAECCILNHKPDNSEHLSLSAERRNLLNESRGNETSKKLVFAEPCKTYESIGNNDKAKELGEQPSLEYANACLENALRLVESASIAKDGCLYVRPSNPIFNIQEINCLHAAILCTAAYVLLNLENYPLAVKRCHQLMSLQNIPGAYQYLGKMYLGEAEFKYGRQVNALEALFQENSCDVNYYAAQDGEDKKDVARSECSWPGQSISATSGCVKPLNEWYPGDELTARAVLVYNQAVAVASSGDLDKACEVLRAWILSKNEGRPLAPEFLKLAVYLHIRLGNVEKAKSLLKNSSMKF